MLAESQYNEGLVLSKRRSVLCPQLLRGISGPLENVLFGRSVCLVVLVLNRETGN